MLSPVMYFRRLKRGWEKLPISGPNFGLNGQSVNTTLHGGSMRLIDLETPVDSHPSWIEERARVAVNRNIRVSGHLVFQEPIRIDGYFRGEVSSSELVVISEDGWVGGCVRSPRLVLLGELEGDIIASKSVVLGPRSRFKGKIEADNLMICEGAYLSGDLRIGCRAEKTPRRDDTPQQRRPGAPA
jgi:cytoskeletal protein CcmA (bactofilin family)